MKKKLWLECKPSLNSPQNQLEAYQHALSEGHHSLVRGASLKMRNSMKNIEIEEKPHAREDHCSSRKPFASP